MAAFEQQESQALVLDCRDHGESDKIVTLYCKNLGRLTGIAKGANKSKKRFMNKLELFTSLTIHYKTSRTGSLVLLTDAQLQESYLKLRQKVPLYNAASVIRELCLLATKEQEGDDGLYSLSSWALDSLNRQRNPLVILCLFLVRFYDRIGYGPNFSNCFRCGRPSSEKGSSFTFHSGNASITCHNCRQDSFRGHKALSPGTLKILQSAQTMELKLLDRLKPSMSAINEALPLLHTYGRQLFQREINSLKYLRNLKVL